jgi:hypothetical protein
MEHRRRESVALERIGVAQGGKMTNNIRCEIVPVVTSLKRDASNNLMRTTTGRLIVEGTAFKTSLPVGSRAGVMGHELTHVNEGATFGYALTTAGAIPLAPTAYPNSAASGKNAWETTDAQSNEARINRELAAGGNAQLTPAENADVFGPTEQFDKMSKKNQNRCSTDATCYSTNPPQP